MNSCHLGALCLVTATIIAAAAPAHGYNHVHSCSPVWQADQLPLSYSINQDGSPDVALGDVEAVVQSSFSAWEAPCCSGFRSQYAGQTDQTAEAPGEDIVLSWTERWPSALGNSSLVIGLTQSQIEPDQGQGCYFSKSGIIFNNQGFSFSTDGAWGSVDLESVVTHEVGHLLGLGHTQYPNATMYARYQGSSSARTLHQDDVEGVCSLYQSQSGCECVEDSECVDGEVCKSGACTPAVDCADHAECPTGEMCVQGVCERADCDGAGDCPQGLVCDGVQCRASCPACASCQTSEDCDGAAFCSEMADGTSRCMLACGPDRVCPGNTRCYGVELGDKQSFGACLNEDVAADGVCPDGFLCVDDGSAAVNSPCPGLGNICDASTAKCGNETICLTGWKSDPICTCQCTDDEDCGANAECETAGSQKYCVPADYSDPPCETATCDRGERCIDGACTVWSPTGEVAPPDVGGGDAGAGDAGDGGIGTNDTGVGDDVGGGPDEPGVGESDIGQAKRYQGYYRGEGCSSGGGSGGPLGLLWMVVGLGVLVGLRRKPGSNPLLAAILAVCVCSLGAAGCDDGDGGGGSTRPVVDAGADASDATSSDAADGGEVVDGPGLDVRPANTTCVAPERPTSTSAIDLERAFANLSFEAPVWMAQPPGDDSRWYVVSQTGTVETFTNEAQVATTQTALSFDDGRVVDGGERGLLGMAFHPDWPSTAELFVSYTTSVDGQLTSRVSKVSARADGVTFDGSTEEIIFEVDQPAGNHNGGQIGFGPDDYLYISLGDGGGGGDTYGNGQNKETPLGAILRIDVTGDETPYGIPADNPFADNGLGETGGAPEIYAWGLRNVWRFSWDRQTGQLWAGDVGQNAWEEIDLIELGGNYGWPAKEGTHCFDAEPCDVGPWIDPVVEYAHEDNNRSVTGGYVYRGEAIPALVGHYVFADYASGRIWQVVDEADTGEPTMELLLETGMPISSFAEDNDGELYVVGYAGQLYRVVDASQGQQGDEFPRRLSETGCVDLDDPTMPAEGLIPFAPNAPFWSDGATKKRWMALPDGETITVEEDGDWTFPQGTVLVKSFEVDGALVETRLFIHHDDGWAGYSYEWDDAQTDAVRVEGGKRKDLGDQEWIFPSGGDCMTCHTRAAGFTLGPETAQLNGALKYPTTNRRANQLETLRHIGLLDGLPAGEPEDLAAMPDPFGNAPQTDRARAYLHTNCSQCHRPNTANVRFPFDTRFTTPMAETDLCDVEPGGADLGVDGARRLAPGEPSKSLIYLRTRRRDAHGMPPLGSAVVDAQGVELLGRWIGSLDGCDR